MFSELAPRLDLQETHNSVLRKVPSNWGVLPMRSLIRARSERNRTDLPLLSVARERGVFVRSSNDDNHNVIPEDLTNYKVARQGDLVINKMKAWQGSLGLSPEDGIVSPAYHVYDFSIENRHFGQALLRSRPYVALLGAASDGVRIGQWDLTVQRFRELPVLIPPADEQAAIVKYLGHAHARIDRAIAAKRKLIALLDEQKRAIIQQAVTRGLDPTVPLKDSGIPWLGEIPAHWIAARVKDALQRNDGGTWGTVFDSAGTIVLRSTEQEVDGSWRIESPAVIVLSGDQVRATLLLDGDIVVTKSSGSQSHIGKASVVDKDVASLGCCFSNFMQRLRPNDKVASEYLGVFLNSRAGREHYRVAARSTTGLGNLTSGIIGRMPLPLPPIDEQRSILKYLTEENAVANELIAHTRQEIELLREFRTRLTSDVVTGQVDVREIATTLPELTDDMLANTSDDAVDTELEDVEDFTEGEDD